MAQIMASRLLARPMFPDTAPAVGGLIGSGSTFPGFWGDSGFLVSQVAEAFLGPREPASREPASRGQTESGQVLVESG